MKSLIICLAMSFTTSVFADSFFNFLGSYEVVNVPQFSSNGDNYYCWHGLQSMKGLTIVQLSRYQSARLTSNKNNLGSIDFNEYTSTRLGINVVAKIVEDQNSASYQVTSSDEFSKNTIVWTISKGEENYHLHISSKSKDKFSDLTSCTFDVELRSIQ